MADTVIVVTVVAVMLISVTFYLLPSIVAMARRVPNTGSAVVINIFLGWTFVGWVIALAMALRSHPQQAVMAPPGWGLGRPGALTPPAGAQQLPGQQLPARDRREELPPSSPPRPDGETAE